MARYRRHDRDLLQARDDWEAVLSADNGTAATRQAAGRSDTRADRSDWENAKYLELLNKYGEPKKANPEALRASSRSSGYRQ